VAGLRPAVVTGRGVTAPPIPALVCPGQGWHADWCGDDAAAMADRGTAVGA
jgi:hypothetical protein